MPYETASVRDRAAQTERTARTILEVERRHLSFLPRTLLMSLAKAVRENEAKGVEGRIIEAGVALGGSAMVLTAAKADDRPISLYDTFGLIPPPGPEDGADVHERWAIIESGAAKGFAGEEYYGYRPGLLESVISTFRSLELDPAENLVSFHTGDFRKTMTSREPVSLVHVDCDWYDSVLFCLQTLAPLLSPGGRFIIDDYDSWSGARKATDEWLAANREFRPERRDGRVHIVRPLSTDPEITSLP